MVSVKQMSNPFTEQKLNQDYQKKSQISLHVFDDFFSILAKNWETTKVIQLKLAFNQGTTIYVSLVQANYSWSLPKTKRSKDRKIKIQFLLGNQHHPTCSRRWHGK